MRLAYPKFDISPIHISHGDSIKSFQVLLDLLTGGDGQIPN